MQLNSNNKHDETTLIELVDSFKKLSGLKLFKELLKWVFTGIFMGASDAIPGYSGGTTLALVGFFKRLILIAKSVFVPEEGLTRKKALAFMLPFSFGWILGIFGFAKLTEFLAHHGLGLELICFFAFFVLFAIPVFLRGSDPGLWGESGKKSPGRKWRIALAVLGFIVVLTIALIMRFVRGGAPFHGHEVANASNSFDIKNEWWKLILVAYGAGCVTIMPGGSGALIQLLANFYAVIHWDIMANVTSSWVNFGGLLIFGTFSFAGMVTMIFVFSWLIKNYEQWLTAVSFGMLIASFFAILIVVRKSDSWEHITDWRHLLGAILACVLGTSTAFIIKWQVDLHIKKTRNKKPNNIS